MNILHIPAKDAYAYGRRLIEILFTKEERMESLVFKSDRSEKRGLPPERVELMLGKSPPSSA
jgi:hypothetical protein